MVLGNENDLALANENEGEGDGVVTPGLVDVGRFPPKNISESQSKLLNLNLQNLIHNHWSLTVFLIQKDLLIV